MNHPSVEPVVAPSDEYGLIKALYRIAKAVRDTFPLFPNCDFAVMMESEAYLRSQEQDKAPIYKDEIPHR